MNKTLPKAISLTLIAVCSLGWEAARGQVHGPLLFPKDDYTVETMRVRTSAGERDVTYHSYMHIPYVANPVDKDYQSLNVSVPIQVDGVTIDATKAPVLFNITVGGYMSVNNATGPMGAPPPPGAAGPGRSEEPGGPRTLRPGGNSSVSSKQDLALAAGYVVVTPGARGRDNLANDGTYYGKAPAAIVDLKAAVRYIRSNDSVMPGNANWIVSTGCSAGGALSALLGASGNSPLYDEYLEEIGAADVDDHIFASACFSPITDLEHSDMSYEWMYGTTPTRSGVVDQELSRQLRQSYGEYQESLGLEGKNGFGPLTADNYDEYLLLYYLIPSANEYLNDLTDEERKEYLATNRWITWSGNSATFAFGDYVAHVGRMKSLPAFDDFDMRQPEPILFGNRTTDARHFTNFSLRQASGNPNAEIDDELRTAVNMMNAMYFLGQNDSDVAGYWWLRNGTRDNHNSQTVMVNLATTLENRNKEVNAWVFWDGGHCADYDPEGLIAWIGNITGFPRQPNVGNN
ncbi:MAG: Tat pathway signal sequence domain protein [Gemmatimonadota bacterium]|nr:MAG: Tat pathway signal sequence domain protein [Gemmatimonadota bacterium]